MTSYTNATKRFCSVYKSSKRAEMYLYVDRSQDVSKLPEALMQAFGAPTKVLDLILTPEKELARADASTVLEAIAEKEFYLQMPPVDSESAENLAMAPRDSLNG
ncbi:hypothetical protein A3762_09335 [Oleiphilus sp. HI0125]|uniref:YcgL domain-containing protein n=1 Tax=Oleiphilus sp. HI0125 TaxID=1822266 RepID=UPI0007C24D82|nr:YcgL domain-containing protein [Oleiphilus sp. HI0125]KZZ57707.1 hypothetical protein A3762_09335 [Oleiphilus sp. HI0125]